MPDTRDELIRSHLEILHKDIALANTYRLETTKFLLAIVTALFAFTVSFRPTLKVVEGENLMWIGWLGLAASLGGGIFELFGWENFYISYRLDYKKWKEDVAAVTRGKSAEETAAAIAELTVREASEAGKAARATITCWRRLARTIQFTGFILGVGAIAYFSALNLHNVVPKP
jgi:hypothetical protein